MIIKFDNTEINNNAFAKITKSAKVYDKNFKLGSTICETYKMQVNKEAVEKIPSVVEIQGNNLFDINKPAISKSRANCSSINNVLTVTVTSTDSANSFVTIPIPNSSELLGKTITLSANMSTNGGVTMISFYGLTANGSLSGIVGSSLMTDGGSETFTLPSTFPSNVTQYGLVFQVRRNSTGAVGSTSTYWNVMLEEESAKTSYEKYTHKTLYVTDYSDENDFVYELSLEDAMTKFNFRYDASEIFVDDHTTLLAIFQDICTKAGVNTDINTFYGSTMQIGVYDNTYTARDYLGYIAEINGKNFRMNNDNKLEFVDINTTPTNTIGFEDISRFKIGVQHTITRVVLGDWQYGNETGETYYISEDNPYAKSQETVQHIYNEINGFTYYNFKTDNCPMTNLKVGDLVKFTYGNDEYVTFVQYDDANFSGGEWFGGIEVNLDSLTKQETQIVGDADRYRNIKRQVDVDKLRIDQVIEDIGDRTGHSSSITQEINNISLEVNEKVDEDEIIAKLNVAVQDGQGVINLVGNTVTIDSDNFDLNADGNITAKSGNIGGFALDSTSFNKNLSGKYNYTLEDAILCLNVYLEYLQDNTGLDYILDYNNDGDIDLTDATKINNIIRGTEQNTRDFAGKFEINSNDLKDCLVFKNNNNEKTTTIGLGGINTDYISAKNFACGEYSLSQSGFKGCLINGKNGNIVVKELASGGADTQIQAGKMILNDGNGHIKEISPKEEYSTTEQYTGKVWIDGKKIYRTIINTNVPSTANTWTAVSNAFQNIDTVINCTGMSAGYFVPCYVTDGSKVSLRYSNSQKKIMARESGFENQSLIVFFEYTKTTN